MKFFLLAEKGYIILKIYSSSCFIMYSCNKEEKFINFSQIIQTCILSL